MSELAASCGSQSLVEFWLDLTRSFGGCVCVCDNYDCCVCMRMSVLNLNVVRANLSFHCTVGDKLLMFVSFA